MTSEEEKILHKYLYDYAMANGYVSGATVKGMTSGRPMLLKGDFRFYPPNQASIGMVSIYRDGVWAEIIHDATDPAPVGTKPEEIMPSLLQCTTVEQFISALKIHADLFTNDFTSKEAQFFGKMLNHTTQYIDRVMSAERQKQN